MTLRARLLATASVLILGACSGCAQQSPQQSPPPNPDQSAVAFNTLDQTLFSGVPSQQSVVVRDAAAWTSLWMQHTSNRMPAPAAPAVDFAASMVVGVFVGARPSGCYSVGITRVLQGNSTTTVEYQERIPGRSDACTAVITHPAHLAAVPLASGTVRFVSR